MRLETPATIAESFLNDCFHHKVSNYELPTLLNGLPRQLNEDCRHSDVKAGQSNKIA